MLKGCGEPGLGSLQSVEYPPPPMSVVAKGLGYDQSFLYKYFPDLCKSDLDQI